MADFLCVASACQNEIEIFSTVSHKRLHRIALPHSQGPYRMVYDDGCLYHADCYSSTVGKIDLSDQTNNQILTVGAYPTGLCFIGETLFVCCGEADSLWAIDKSTLTALHCVKAVPFPIDISTDGETIVMAGITGAQIARFSADMQEQSRVLLDSGEPLCVKCIPGGLLAGLQADSASSLMKLCDGVTTSVNCPTSSKIDLLGDYCLLAHSFDSSLSMVRVSDLKLVKTVQTGKMPDDIAVDSTHKLIYVSCIAQSCVDVFNAQLDRVAVINTLDEPRALALF